MGVLFLIAVAIWWGTRDLPNSPKTRAEKESARIKAKQDQIDREVAELIKP